MKTEIKAELIQKNKGQFTNKETGQVFDYQNILIAYPEDENTGNVLKISVPLEIDVTKLQLYKEYIFNIEIPLVFNERSKVKLISVKGV